MKLKTGLILLLALLAATPCFAQVKELCDSSTKCAAMQDLDVGDDLAVLGDSLLQTSRGTAFTLKTVSTTVTASGATSAATSLIPAGSFVYGCGARVTTVIAGATTWDLGDGSDADKWANDEALTVGTTTGGTDFTSTANPLFYTSAVSPTFTANGSNFTSGVFRVECVIATLTGPTS